MNPFVNALLFLLEERAQTGGGPGADRAHDHIAIVRAAMHEDDLAGAQPQQAETGQPDAAIAPEDIPAA